MIDAAIHVGCRDVAVTDEVQGARVPVRVLYPTTAAPRTERFGAYTIDLALDAPVTGAPLSLVAVSHGSGGTPWGLRGLASHLARHGCAVALIEHPGNSRSDNSLADTPANLANRPRHVRLALDAAFGDPALGPHLVPGVAGVVGHSMGGYTALAVAGGRPIALPEQSPDRVARPVEVEPDPRVCAVVLLAPALPWLMAPGALAGVHAAVLVRTCERDEYTPPYYVDAILRGLPAGVALDSQVVPGAGHFAFFWPVPAALAGPSFPPSIDPPGFDRAAYQPRLYGEVLGFLRATLRDHR